nr:MAG TPA: hypothetical protein [Caudoviricetes sp.]
MIFNEKQLTITFLSGKVNILSKKILTTLKVNDILTLDNNQKMRKIRQSKETILIRIRLSSWAFCQY